MLIEKEVRDINRLKEIFSILVKYEFGPFLKGMSLPIWKRKPAVRAPTPEGMLAMFEELGGTFIKLGQLLSIRPDLIPPEYCAAFRKLQDQVPPIPFPVVKSVVEQELNRPLAKTFSSFSEKPIASASIGQVHLARLRGGELVAVKVQRPGIRQKIQADIDILYVLARFIQRHYKPRLFNPIAIVKEFEEYSSHEVDYVREAKNIDRFSANFAESREVVIPKVHWDYTTSKVLTMQYLEGKRASDIKIKEPRLVIERTVRAIFKQIFEDGFFHADPHPGNILILSNHRIAFVDFGIVGVIDPNDREGMISLFVSMIQGNLDAMAEALYELGFVNATYDPIKLKHGLREAFGEYYNLQVENIDLEEIFHTLLRFSNEQNMELPADFVLLGKALVTLEGFAGSIDPHFNIVEFSKPYAVKLLSDRSNPVAILRSFARQSSYLRSAVIKFPRQIDELLGRARDAEHYVDDIDQDLRGLTHEIAHASERISLALLIAGFIVAGALIIPLPQPWVLDLPLYSLICFGFAAFFFVILFGSVTKRSR